MHDTATRALPTGLKVKLAPLLRLQSSDNAGERANASAAIGRLLKNHGLDWHDLTDGRPIARLSEKQWKWLQDLIEETGM